MGEDNGQQLRDHQMADYQGVIMPGNKELPPAEPPPDPERNRLPEATHRSAPNRNPPARRLIETAYAVLDDADAVEDYTFF
jgi:hypothetical protein